MAAILTQPTNTPARKQHSLKIDMTPMVDLGFLLITFFIFTATLSQPRTTRLIMPKEGEETFVAESKSLTLLLASEKVIVYQGRWENAVQNKTLIETTYDLQSGMGKQIREKQKSLADKDDLTIIIKPLATASYQQVITALDEMQINKVNKYAVVDASENEISYLQNQ